MIKKWNLKVKVDCPTCLGTGETYEGPPCPTCKGTGKKFVGVPPKEIDRFIARPEKTEYLCSGCNKKEIILRPLGHQIPSGWINWDGSLFCRDCRLKLIDAALIAVASKIQQLKERKRRDE